MQSCKHYRKKYKKCEIYEKNNGFEIHDCVCSNTELINMGSAKFLKRLNVLLWMSIYH